MNLQNLLLNTSKVEIDINKEMVPECVGLIMDGNRTWAKNKGLPSVEGYRQGAEKLKEVIAWSEEFGVKHVVVYAFSSENWQRPVDEVAYLMKLVVIVFNKYLKELCDKGVRVRFIGDRDKFDKSVLETIELSEKKTKDNDVINLTIAFSYGGRAEIVDAVKRIVERVKKGDEVTLDEDAFSQYLWTKDIPDPDLIIRVGGQQRLSNFLTWQSTYSELVFLDTLWPAFEKKEYESIINEYSSRQRNFGK